jgi:AcrR family transcriptional regulator
VIDPTRQPLPLADEPPPERRDAARNRVALLDAAVRLVERRGADCVTMETLAAEAGVGKGTVFRRFGSRAGLMAAVLDHSEAGWQRDVLSGPPPLGPGAPPMDRLLAFGNSRIDINLLHADLFRAADRAGRSYAAYTFAAMHTRFLLRELRVRGDLALLATALMAPIEAVVLTQELDVEHMDLDRIRAGWADLVRRIVRNPTETGEP